MKARLFSDWPLSVDRKGRAVPSTAFLVILNSVLFFALNAIGANVLGIILAVMTTLMFAVVSGLIHLMIRLGVEKGRFLAPIPRTLVYLGPLWGLLLLSLVLPKSPDLPNQVTPSTSPSGNYRVSVRAPIGGWEFAVQSLKDQQKWTVETPIMSHFNVYWMWDAEDRLWIYNSDDGGISFLERTADDWVESKWGYSRTKDPDFPRDIRPPESLYPEYARP
jgi:hypothetical protein